jgi:ADP-ribose pyrophosphatase YjhB (NUDIX family)
MKRFLLWLWKVLPMNRGMQFRALSVLNPRFLLGVNGVVVDDLGRVLLLKHTYRNTYPWGLPSGWARRGEQPEETLIREIREEVGLAVRVVSVLDARVDKAYPRLDLTFLCRPAGPVGEVRPRDSEIERAGFFRRGEFPDELSRPQPELIDRGLAELGFTVPG